MNAELKGREACVSEVPLIMQRLLLLLWTCKEYDRPQGQLIGNLVEAEQAYRLYELFCSFWNSRHTKQILMQYPVSSVFPELSTELWLLQYIIFLIWFSWKRAELWSWPSLAPWLGPEGSCASSVPAGLKGVVYKRTVDIYRLQKQNKNAAKR